MSELAYGYIKRGEDLKSCFIQPLIQSNIFESKNLTVKYLQSYLLQKSDIELRIRLLTFMHKQFAIPLVANRMIKYGENHLEFEKEYFPEISLIMDEGIGIFNFGVGELGSIRCGKT